MKDQSNNLFSRWFLNDTNYHRLIAISILLLIIIWGLVFVFIEPTEHSDAYHIHNKQPSENSK